MQFYFYMKTAGSQIRRELNMDYIHRNPCQPHWKLVESPEEYLWSTAGFYLDGKPCVIPIDYVRGFLL